MCFAKRVVLLVFCILSGFTAHVYPQQSPDPWAKKTAIITTTGGVQVRVENRVIGKTKELLVWVKKSQGDWIWIHSGEGVEGWILKSQAVPLDQAYGFFTARIQRNAQDAEAYYRRAVALLNTRRPDEAMQDVSQALRLSPNEGAYYNCRGNIWMNKDDPDKALADFQHAIHLSPSDAFYYGNAARAWLKKKNIDQAIALATQGIQLDAKLFWIYRIRREAYEEKKEFLKAYIDYRSALRLDPESEDWLFEFDDTTEGVYLLEQVPDAELAAYRPKDGDEYADRAAAWGSKRKYSEAVADYNEALRARPADTYLRWSRGWNLYKLGRIEEALPDLDAAVAVHGKVAGSFNDRGLIRLAAKEYRGAIDDFSRALRLYPGFQGAQFNRGWAHYQQGQYALAIADYSKASRQWFPNDGPERYFDRGWSLSNKEPPESLPFEPLDAYTQAFRGDVWTHRGQFEKATADLDAADKLDPNFKLAAYCRAVQAAIKRNPDQTLAELKAVLDAHPDCGPAHYERATIRALRGEYTAAASDFEEAIRLDAEDHFALRAAAWLLATCPQDNIRQGARAVELARKACELNAWKGAAFLTALAAAYAENGDFEQAVSWQTKALASAVKEDRPVYQALLELFKKGQPYRTPAAKPPAPTELQPPPSTAQTVPPAGDQPATPLEAIQQQQPSFYVRASCDHPSHTYYEAETLGLKVQCEIDAYLYVVYQQADGKTYQIFPNSVHSDNRVKAGVATAVPAADDLFRWEVSAPFGKEKIKVIASRKPLDSLADLGLQKAIFNPVSREDISDVCAELNQQAPRQWVETELEITTIARRRVPFERKPQRLGVFFGVSKYEFDAEIKAARGTGLNLNFADKDAALLTKVFKEVGKMDEVRVNLNQDATRANLEHTMTRWLPSVSWPGDTIVIYFSGHGGQISDDNGDELDSTDEVLITHDMLNFAAIKTLSARHKAGKLDPKLEARVMKLSEIFLKDPARAEELLMRETSVSDDLFGRWLQCLDGRQVVVILDICFSGGFAENAKDIPAADTRFDFLDRELSRLKDIGQRETALFAASGPHELSLEGITGPQGVMTSFLAETLTRGKQPLGLQQTFDQTAGNMETFFKSEQFRKMNEQRRAAGKEEMKPQHAYLLNQCSQMPILKP